MVSESVFQPEGVEIDPNELTKLIGINKINTIRVCAVSILLVTLRFGTKTCR